MSDVLEKSLDEIIGDTPRGPRQRSSNPRRDRERSRDRERRPKGNSRNFRDREDRYVPPRQTKIQRLSQGRPYLKITDLHYDITEDELRNLFEKIGEVSFSLIIFNHAGRSSGTAYLGFKKVSLNREAIEKFDGRKAVGQIITVEEIKPLNIGLSPKFSEKRGSRPRDQEPKSNNGARERKARPTTEDLDKELELYMSGTPEAEKIEKTEKTEKAKKTAEDLDKELEDYMSNKPFPAAE